MNHFKTQRAEPHLPECPHSPSARQIGLLRRVEVKKPQVQMTGAIAHADNQAASAAVHHIRKFDIAFDDGVASGAETPDWKPARAILIAQGKMEQDILNCMQAETLEFFPQFRTDTLQRRDR
jgi:hypothetical protein